MTRIPQLWPWAWLSHSGGLAANRDRLIGGVALVTLVGSAGLFALWPQVGIAVAVLVALVLVPALWLAGRWNGHAVLGAFLYLTILRPLPLVAEATASAQFVTDRALDVVWFAMAIAVVIYMYRGAGGHLKVWRGQYWLAASGATVAISLVAGRMAEQPFVPRDLFEFYRAPFYLLVLLGATQVAWDREDLSEHLVKPLLAALAVSCVIALIQMDMYTGKEAVTVAYVTKFAELRIFDSGILATTSGTFTNPNWYAVTLGLMLPIAWAVSSTSKRPGYLALSAVVIAALIMLSGSRTGLIASLVGTGIYALLWAARYAIPFWRSSTLPIPKVTVISWLAVVLVFGTGAMLSARHHATAEALGRGAISEISSLIGTLWPFEADDAHISDTGKTPLGDRAITERKSLVEELRSATVAGYQNESFDRKYDGAIALTKEVWDRSPLFGLGPSKSRGRLLGDNQYSLILYRYGVIGLLVSGAFWISLGWTALGTWWRRPGLDAPYGAAILAMTAVMIVAGLGGAFFDARQIATVFLLLAGIAMSVRLSAPTSQEGRDSGTGSEPADG